MVKSFLCKPSLTIANVFKGVTTAWLVRETSSIEANELGLIKSRCS